MTFLDKEDKIMEVEDNEYYNPDDVVLPSDGEYDSIPQNGIFSKNDTNELKETCRTIIRSGPLSITRVTQALQLTTRGSFILSPYEMF